MKIQSLPKIATTIVAIITLLLLGGGILAHTFMDAMPECPMTQAAHSFCGATLAEQITLFTRWFSGLPQTTMLFAILIAIAIIIPRPDKAQCLRARLRPYLTAHAPIISLFYFFRRLFASGILHPKLHA